MLIFSHRHVPLLLLVLIKINGAQEPSDEALDYQDDQDVNEGNEKVDNLIQMVNALAEKVGGLESSMEDLNDNSENLENLNEMVSTLIEKMTIQETLIEDIDAWKVGVQDDLFENDSLADKVGIQDDLVEKVDALEKKVDGLEVEMKDLVKENIFLKTKGAKTCSELKANGFNESGFYDIDPAYSGLPMQVHCDMLTGATEVSHDVMDTVDIGYCSGVGCFNQEYTYSAPLNQIEALISMSSTCEQDIKFDCNIAPLKNSMFGFYYGWWVDRHGEKKFYLDGENEDLHVCGCYPNCQQSMFNNTCNCDASLVPFWNLDSGKITSKDSLPVKNFIYGGFLHEQQKAKITVGNLRCNGAAASASDMTSTCSSLKKRGTSVSGFYLTKPSEDADLQVSYCRMSASGYDEDDISGAAMDLNQRTRMLEIGVTSYVFQSGASYSSSWKNLIDLQVNTSAIENDLKDFGIELDLKGGRITFLQSGVYVFINIDGSSTHTAWQVGSGYSFNKVYYIEKGQKITFTGHGNVKYFELGIIPLHQIPF